MHARSRILVPLLACLLIAGFTAGAVGQDLQSQLDQRRSELDSQRDRKGVLSSELDEANAAVDQLAGQVAVLRNREAVVVAQLRGVQRRLNFEKERLAQLHAQLRRSLNVLRERLVGIYRSGSPDLMTVLLQSDGFGDLVTRYEYLRRISENDSSLVGRVRGLRDGARITVERVTDDRDEIAAKKAELVRTRSQLEAREAELAAARDSKAAALDEVESSIDRLEGDVSDLQGRIQEQLQNATATPGVAPLPAGPVQALPVAGSGRSAAP